MCHFSGCWICLKELRAVISLRFSNIKGKKDCLYDKTIIPVCDNGMCLDA